MYSTATGAELLIHSFYLLINDTLDRLEKLQFFFFVPINSGVNKS